MDISFIVAMGRNRVIGKDGALPWHISGDLKFFKANTLGKPIVMGRKTYDSIGRPLPGRPNIVITRQPDYALDKADVVHTLDESLDLAAEKAKDLGADEIMVIGGEQIFAACFDKATRLYITEVDLAPEGDAYFPHFNPSEWQETFREKHDATDESPGYSFVIYDRK